MNERKSFASSIAVIDLLYFAYLFIVVLLSTIGLSAGDELYLFAVALGAVFVVVRFLTLHFDSRFILIAMLLTLLGIIELSITKRFTILLTVLLVLGARGLGMKELLGVFLAAKIIGLALVGAFVATGIYEVEFYQYYKMATASYVQRVLINGSSTNVMHLSFLAIIFLSFYEKEGRFSWRLYVLFALLNIAFEQITNSYIGLFLGMGGILLFCLLQHSKSIRKKFVKISTLVLPLLILFSLVTGFMYGSNGTVSLLDKLFQGRIYYNHYFLVNYPISLFGHGMLSSEGNFDNSFIFVYVAYGLVCFCLLFGLMQSLVIRMKKAGDWIGLVIVVVYLIAGLSESFYPSAAVNPSLFFLIGYFTVRIDDMENAKKKGALKGCVV